MSVTVDRGTRTHDLPMRVVGAVALLVAAIAHVVAALAFGGLFGVLFVASALGTALGAVLLFVRPTWGWAFGGLVAGLTLLGYILRSAVGIPGLVSRPMSFLTPTSGLVSAVAEIVAVVLAVYALSRLRRQRR